MSAPESSVVARHVTTRDTVRLTWRDRLLTEVCPVSEPADPHLWVAPTLVDLQVNGYAGIDFQRDGFTADDLRKACAGLAADGCRRWCLTLITEAWPLLLNRLRHARELRQQDAALREAIVGWHIEGPFLSDQPGFAGAHRAEVMCDPAPDHMRQLKEITGDDPVLVTVAPERPGAESAIRAAIELGFRVSLGHTNASAEQIAKAVQAGATGFTHLGNGCPRELDRHDNIIWRVLDQPDLLISLIVDRIHVSPALFRLVHKALPPERLYYTTDAMAAAGAPPGRYTLGASELEVGPDQVVRQPGSALFAGSALRPIDGIRRAAAMLGCEWQEVWPHFSDIPARWMHLEAGLEVGNPADFCLLRTNDANEILSCESF